MHVIMVLQRLEKFAGVGALLVGQFRKAFGDITELTGHDRPAIGGEPLRDGV